MGADRTRVRRRVRPNADASAGARGRGLGQIGTVSAPGGPSLRDSYGRRLQLEGVDLVGKCGGGARPQTGRRHAVRGAGQRPTTGVRPVTGGA